VSPPHQDQFHLINKEPNHIDIIWIGFIGNQIIKEDMNIIVTILIYAIPLAFAMRAIILAIALIIDAIIGEPDILWRYLPHPGGSVRPDDQYIQHFMVFFPRNRLWPSHIRGDCYISACCDSRPDRRWISRVRPYSW
jgi:hypothetical protein